MATITQNTTDLQALLAQVNALPEAGGVDLPELTNPGTASDLLSGKELIDGEGNVVTGTIATKTSSNLTASGATVTVPAGYYASQATKSVSTATQATPSITVSSAGLITASATQSAGYVSSGTKSATKQLTTQAAQTITPGTSDQTIASGTYCSGAQTIKGDANLVASNIKSGVSIFGVTGTYVGTSEDLDSVITELETKTATLNTTLDGKAAGGGSVEWQDVFALPTTYVAARGTRSYYVEIPASFKAIMFRYSYNDAYYCHSIVAVGDESVISVTDTDAACGLSMLSDENVFQIWIPHTNGTPVVTTAEYLLI